MKPSFNVDLSFVDASYESPFGTIKSNWKKLNGQLDWKISVPGNAIAVVYIPAKEMDVKEAMKPASSAEGVKFLGMEEGKALFQIGSGNYSFHVEDYRLTGN